MNPAIIIMTIIPPGLARVHCGAQRMMEIRGQGERETLRQAQDNAGRPSLGNEPLLRIEKG